MLPVDRMTDAGTEKAHILDGAAPFLKRRVHSLGVLPDLGLFVDKQMAAVARRTFHQLQLESQLGMI